MHVQVKHLPGTIALAMMLVMAVSSHGWGASTLTLSSPGNGVFVLQGTALASVSALDVVLRYDTATLGNPRVELGGLLSGAMMAANPNVPGTMRVAVIRLAPVSGGGTLLTFFFDLKSDAPGSITGLTVRSTDINGKTLPALVQVIPAAPVAATNQESAIGEPAAGSSASRTGQTQPSASPPAPLPLTLAGSTKKKSPDQDVKDAPQKEPAPAVRPLLANKDVVATKVSDTGPKSKPVHLQKSVLNLFREFKGERTPKTLAALFDQESRIGFRQEPRIALADGKSTMIVFFLAPADMKGSPDVALMGAGLRSLTPDPDQTNTWKAVVRPEKKAVSAGMTIPLKDFSIVFPLTVAPGIDPDLNGSGKVTIEDFQLYLKAPGEQKVLKYDWNRNGKMDPVDDYIYTANYLLKAR